MSGDAQLRLAEYAKGEDPLNDAEVASVQAGRCGPLLYGGPCWLMPGHVGPHHCYREDIDAVTAHARHEGAAEVVARVEAVCDAPDYTTRPYLHLDAPGIDTVEVTRLAAALAHPTTDPDG